MTRQEAIELLKPFRNCMLDQYGCPISDVVFALDIAIEGSKEWEVTTMSIDALNRVEVLEKLFAEMLEQAKLESKDGDWVPISERLPEEYDQYLCYCEGGECYVYWLDNEPWVEETVEKERILAWKPLPAPYKESDSE